MEMKKLNKLVDDYCRAKMACGEGSGNLRKKVFAQVFDSLRTDADREQFDAAVATRNMSDYITFNENVKTHTELMNRSGNIIPTLISVGAVAVSAGVSGLHIWNNVMSEEQRIKVKNFVGPKVWLVKTKWNMMVHDVKNKIKSFGKKKED